MQNEELNLLLRQGVDGDPRPGVECPDEAGLAGFVEGTLVEEEAAKIRRHVAGCDHCLAQVGLLARLEEVSPPEVPTGLLARVHGLAERPAGPSRRWSVAAAVAAVLLLVLWVAPLGEVERRKGEPDEVRFGAELLRPPEILAPSEGELVAASRLGGLEVRWTPVPQAIYYELRLVTADGDRLWDGRSENGRLEIPPGLPVAAGEDLFVWVRAYLPEGKTLQSGIVGFRVAGGGELGE